MNKLKKEVTKRLEDKCKQKDLAPYVNKQVANIRHLVNTNNTSFNVTTINTHDRDNHNKRIAASKTIGCTDLIRSKRELCRLRTLRASKQEMREPFLSNTLFAARQVDGKQYTNLHDALSTLITQQIGRYKGLLNSAKQSRPKNALPQ